MEIMQFITVFLILSWLIIAVLNVIKPFKVLGLGCKSRAIALVHLISSFIILSITLTQFVPGTTSPKKTTSSHVASKTKSKTEETADNATRICIALENTGMTTECKVGWGGTLDVWIDTNGSEARKMCTGIASLVAKQGAAFPGWKLRIFSPYSGDHPIATCNLQ